MPPRARCWRADRSPRLRRRPPPRARYNSFMPFAMRGLAALALLAFLPDAPPAPAPTPRPAARPAPRNPEWVWSLADSLDRKITAIERRLLPAKNVRVTEGELNSYLNLMPTSALPKGVSDVKVQIQRDGVFARGMVDLEKVKGKVHS